MTGRRSRRRRAGAGTRARSRPRRDRHRPRRDATGSGGGRPPFDRHERHRSHAKASPTTAPSSRPSFRASVRQADEQAGKGKRSPVALEATRGQPQRDQPDRLVRARCCPAGRRTEWLPPAGRRPARRRGPRFGALPASRATSQVSGAERAPMSMNGRADASAVGPSSQIVGSWTIEARGIQKPLLGIGQVRISRDVGCPRRETTR